MTGWVCVKCCQPVEADGWCTTCEDEFAVEVLEPVPHIQRGDYQFRRICHYLRHRGYTYLPDRMAVLSELVGRDITRYEDVTVTEATRLIPQLRRWAYGPRT